MSRISINKDIVQAVSEGASQDALSIRRRVVTGGLQALRDVTVCDEVALIVLRADAPWFCAGADIGYFEGEPEKIDEARAATPETQFGLSEVTLGLLVSRYGISRAEQDPPAFRRQHCENEAITAGRCENQIIPVEVKQHGDTTVFEIDEHMRPSTTMSDLPKRPILHKEKGAVTAGNASGVDGASLRGTGFRQGSPGHCMQPLALLGGYGHTGGFRIRSTSVCRRTQLGIRSGPGKPKWQWCHARLSGGCH